MIASRFYGGRKLTAGFVRRNIDLDQRSDERWPKPSKSTTKRDMLQFCEFFAAKFCPLKTAAFGSSKAGFWPSSCKPPRHSDARSVARRRRNSSASRGGRR